MQTILRIDASSRGTGSLSRSLGDYFEAAWLDRNPRDRVIRRDVAAEPIGHIANPTIAGFYTPADQLTEEMRTATTLSDLLITPRHDFLYAGGSHRWPTGRQEGRSGLTPSRTPMPT